MTIRTDARLADGRDIYYFDREAGRDRRPDGAPADRRELTPAVSVSEIRWNALLRDYSVIAGHRQERTYKPAADHCPLDPSSGERLTEIPAGDYEVAVFENRFPSFSLGSADRVELVDRPPFRSGPGAGRCEVVCFSSEHDVSFAQLPIEQVETVLDAWIDRTESLSRIPSVDYVFCFENRGEEIGVTLTHPHGQIYGYPFIPPRFYRTAEALEHHAQRTGRCLQCELLGAEVDAAKRVVAQGDHWVAYVPFAARWPYEVRVVPRRHVPDLPALDPAERRELARLYRAVLRGFDTLFDTPAPYIAGWHQAPVRQSREVWHLGAEIFTIRRSEGRLKYLAGSESGAAVWINDVAPEQAAERLRAAIGQG